MKYLILITVLFGLAYASDDVIETETRSLNLTKLTTTLNDVVAEVTGLDISNKTDAITDFLSGAGFDTDAIAAIGTAGSVGAVITAISALKTAVLGVLSAPLAIANGILSLIGLVLLIVFLIEGGDFLSLIGKSSEDLYLEPLTQFRSLTSSWSFSDVINHKYVDNLSKMVYKALEKYE